MRALLVVGVLVGCGSSHVEVDPVSEPEAKAFVDDFLKASHPPCSIDAVEPLLDYPALGSRLMDLKSPVRNAVREFAFKTTQQQRSFGQMVCGWFGNDAKAQFKLLHLVDGAPIVRMLWKPKNVTVVTYFRLFLGKRKNDGKVLLDDLYSFADGFTVSQNLNDFMTAGDDAGVIKAKKFVDQIQTAKRLQQQGDARSAMATLDGMDTDLQHVRGVEMMRIAIAQDLGEDAYARELHALVAKYPNDPSIALLQIDEATTRKDYGAALHAIDVLDHAVGGDPYQDTIRSSIYVAMGDAAKALATAKHAADAEPGVARTQLALLDAYVLQGDFAAVRKQLDVLANMDTVLTASGLRTLPLYDKFTQSPEFADWQTLHP